MKTISLDFKGYRRDVNKGGLEEDAGIYCVYRCVYDKDDGTVDLKELLYIGEADNIHDRLDNHERLDDWKAHLKKGEQLCYSRAHIADKKLRLRAEAALIYYHKPCENTQHINDFGYPETEMKLSGDCEFLEKYFIVSD